MEKFNEEAKQILADITNGSTEDPTKELVEKFIFGDVTRVKVVFSGAYKDTVIPAIRYIADDNLKLSGRVIGIGDDMSVERCSMIGNLDIQRVNQLIELSRTELKGKIKIYIEYWREVEDVLSLQEKRGAMSEPNCHMSTWRAL